MNVDIPEKALSKTHEPMLGDFRPDKQPVGQVQAAVNPKHTGLSGECQE
jgi:hypothetical protein